MELGLSITINTNASLISTSLRSLWHRLPPAYVNVTLYGTCREDYRQLCGDAEAFDRVMDALQWLRQEGILTHLNTTITPTNAARWQEIENLAKSLGYDLRMTTYCFPPIRRSGCTECAAFSRLTAEDAANLIVKDLLYREGMDAIRLRAMNLDAPPRSDCSMEVGEPMRCMAGRSQFWIDWKGDMTPCGMMTQPIAWPIRDGFNSAWDKLRTETGAIRLCPDCANCDGRLTCMNCAAVIYTETGSFTGKPEYMCRLNKEYRRLIKETADSVCT